MYSLKLLERISFVGLVLAILALLFYLTNIIGAKSQKVEAVAVPHITICHATNSNSNPYVTNHPEETADVQGHDGHNGPIWFPGITVDWGDIIPPFINGNVHYPGKNWTTLGMEVWNNDCSVPTHKICVELSCKTVDGTGDNACNHDSDCKKPTPTPTPTPTPKVTPTPTPEPNNPGSGLSNFTTGANVNVCNGSTVAAPILQGFEEVSPTEVKWSWWPSTDGGDYQYLLYGPTANDLRYSILNIPANVSSIDTGSLNWTGNRWAQVCVVKNSCVACSNVLDP